MPVFDQGYQHWHGKLSGHGWRWLAIARHGIRTQLNGRYVRLLMIFAWVPAFVLVGALASWGLVEQGALGTQQMFQFFSLLTKSSDPHACRQAIWTISFSIFFMIEIYFIMLIVTLAGPNLISRDLRNNALPLYFSRPMTRLDYFLGKMGVIGFIVAMVALLPAVVAYILGVCFSLDFSVLRDTWRLLPACLMYGAIIVVSAGTLMLALSSLSKRSLYVGLAWFGFCLISWVVGMVLESNMYFDVERRIVSEQQHAQATMYYDQNRGRFYRQNPDSAAPKPETMQEALAKAKRTDWRPLFSYASNIQRLGEVSLSTDEAYVKLGRAVNEAERKTQAMFGGSYGAPPPTEETPGDRDMADFMVMQYPWTWSAGVLAALVGLSLCTLSLRVKSLDRLR